MNVNVPKGVQLHLETAEKLLEGIRETLTVLKKNDWIPPGTFLRVVKAARSASPAGTSSGHEGT